MKNIFLSLLCFLSLGAFAASPSFQQLTNQPGVSGLIATTSKFATNSATATVAITAVSTNLIVVTNVVANTIFTKDTNTFTVLYGGSLDVNQTYYPNPSLGYYTNAINTVIMQRMGGNTYLTNTAGGYYYRVNNNSLNSFLLTPVIFSIATGNGSNLPPIGYWSMITNTVFSTNVITYTLYNPTNTRPIGNFVRVSPIGSDISGTRGVRELPFASISSAARAMIQGDSMFLDCGVYYCHNVIFPPQSSLWGVTPESTQIVIDTNDQLACAIALTNGGTISGLTIATTNFNYNLNYQNPVYFGGYVTLRNDILIGDGDTIVPGITATDIGNPGWAYVTAYDTWLYSAFDTVSLRNGAMLDGYNLNSFCTPGYGGSQTQTPNQAGTVVRNIANTSNGGRLRLYGGSLTALNAATTTANVSLSATTSAYLYNVSMICYSTNGTANCFDGSATASIFALGCNSNNVPFNGGISTSIQFTDGNLLNPSTNTLYFTNGILMKTTQP